MNQRTPGPIEQACHRVLYVGHEASNTGAPRSLIDIASALQERHGVEAEFVLLRGGSLMDRYRAIGPCRVLKNPVVRSDLLTRIGRRVIRSYRRVTGHRARPQYRPTAVPDLVYVNSVAASEILDWIDLSPFKTVLHVREMQSDIAGRPRLPELVEHASRILAVSQPAADALRDAVSSAVQRPIGIVPTFVQRSVADRLAGDRQVARLAARKRLGIPPDQRLVIGCGSANWRKGSDLFLRCAWEHARNPSAEHAVWGWVGKASDQDSRLLRTDMKHFEPKPDFRLLGEFEDATDVLPAADVFAMTSREDPMPRVVLEAAAAGVPTVCFEQTGGAVGFVKPPERAATGGELLGNTVPYGDCRSFADAVEALLVSEPLRQSLADQLQEKIRKHFTSDQVPELIWSEFERILEERRA